jgi:hypothetical protein
MLDLGLVDESEVILAWLRAEIDSQRFGPTYAAWLAAMGCSRGQLIDDGKAHDQAANHERACLMGLVRGYRRNKLLFTEFPSDVIWRRYEITLPQLGQFQYANVEDLRSLSGPSRLVSSGAAAVLSAKQGTSPISEHVDRIWAVKERAQAGERFPELIAVRDSALPHCVLIEGHTRATAYMIAGSPETTSIFVGTSESMHSWSFWGSLD